MDNQLPENVFLKMTFTTKICSPVVGLLFQDSFCAHRQLNGPVFVVVVVVLVFFFFRGWSDFAERKWLRGSFDYTEDFLWFWEEKFIGLLSASLAQFILLCSFRHALQDIFLLRYIIINNNLICILSTEYQKHLLMWKVMMPQVVQGPWFL